MATVFPHVAVGEVPVRGHEVTAVEVNCKVCPELEHVLLRSIAVVHRLCTLCGERKSGRIHLYVARVHLLELVSA